MKDKYPGWPAGILFNNDCFYICDCTFTSEKKIQKFTYEDFLTIEFTSTFFGKITRISINNRIITGFEKFDYEKLLILKTILHDTKILFDNKKIRIQIENERIENNRLRIESERAK